MPLDLSTDFAGAIIFDFDGTLVDSAPSMTRALNEMAAQRGIAPVAISSVRKWVSLGGDAMLKSALGRQVDPASDLDEFTDILRNQVADPKDLYPGVTDALKTLKQAGYRLGICTNKREDIAVPYVAGLGIAENFDAIVGGLPGRRLKPDPELAHMTLDLLGATVGESIFVGDSEIDSETAIAAGFPFVLVTFGYPHGEIGCIAADRRIGKFSALPVVVAELSSSKT